MDQPDKKTPYHACTACSSWANACRPSAEFAGSICRLARTKISSAYFAGKFSLNSSRIKRFTKFLATALCIVFLLTTSPKRAKPFSFLRAYTVNHLFIKRSAQKTLSNSLRCLIRRTVGKVCRVVLDGKTGAAFGSSSLNYCPPTFSFHANQKSMGAFSFSNGGLVCALHFDAPN